LKKGLCSRLKKGKNEGVNKCSVSRRQYYIFHHTWRDDDYRVMLQPDD